MAVTITQLAGELGVRSDTLRFYERSGLIPSAGRTEGGYRLYDDTVADRVRFIKAAQRSGLRLREMEIAVYRPYACSVLSFVRKRKVPSFSQRWSPERC
jgi:DNA-binding transcriptional MerR regulator